LATAPAGNLVKPVTASEDAMKTATVRIDISHGTVAPA
jgi:hypothetical protein